MCGEQLLGRVRTGWVAATPELIQSTTAPCPASPSNSHNSTTHTLPTKYRQNAVSTGGGSSCGDLSSGLSAKSITAWIDWGRCETPPAGQCAVPARPRASQAGQVQLHCAGVGQLACAQQAVQSAGAQKMQWFQIEDQMLWQARSCWRMHCSSSGAVSGSSSPSLLPTLLLAPHGGIKLNPLHRVDQTRSGVGTAEPQPRPSVCM